MNFKIKNLNIERYESIALEKYLEDMALDGWILSYLNDNVLRFEKGEKSKLKYSVKRADKNTFWGGTDNNKELELKERYEAEGWSYVTSSFQTNIFVTKNSSAKDPYEMSIRENFNNDIKKSQNSILIKILIYLSVFIGFTIYIGKLNIFKYSNKLETIIVIQSILIIAILYNIFDFINLLRCKLSIKSNVPIDLLACSRKFKFKINFVTSIITVFYISTLALTLLCKIQDLFMIGVPILFILFRIIKFELSYRSKVTGKNLDRYIRLMLLIIILFIGFVFYNTLSISGRSNSDKAPLTLADFNDTSTDNQYYINHKSLISTSFSAYEKGDQYTLYYDFIHIKFKFLVDKYYKDTVAYYSDRVLTYKTDIASYEKLDVPPGMKVHVLSPSKRLIITVKNKILIIDPIENMSTEDLIKIIYNKLN